MVVNLEFSRPLETDSDCLLIGVFEGEENQNGLIKEICEGEIGEGLKSIISEGELTGKRGNSTLIHTLGKLTPSRLLFCGLGSRSGINSLSLRDAISSSLRTAWQKHSECVSIVADSFVSEKVTLERLMETIAACSHTGLYVYDRFKTSQSTRKVEKIRILLSNDNFKEGLQNNLDEGLAVGGAVNLARDLSNAPPNFMTPTDLSESARTVALESGLIFEVLERGEMEKLGMGAILGVAQGSAETPKLIVLKYDGDPANPNNSLALLGKGITFDSGGLDIKSAVGMRTMKGDMAGGAAVIGAMQAIAVTKPILNVVGIVPAVENMPGGRAQRPGDVVTAMDGTTLEIDNTDAEGRLVLADAVCYAKWLGINRIVDVATLTGAVRTALGEQCIGVFGNDPAFTKKIIKAGFECGERVWELPTYHEYSKQFDSDIADIKNSGGPAAGAITGAMIIGRFAGSASWVHLDIAAMSRVTSTSGDQVKGATGSGVRILVAFCQSLS